MAMDARALSGTAAGPRYHLLRRAILAVKGDLRDVSHGHIDAVGGLLVGPSGRSTDLPGGLRASISYGELTVAGPGVDRSVLPSLEGGMDSESTRGDAAGRLARQCGEGRCRRPDGGGRGRRYAGAARPGQPWGFRWRCAVVARETGSSLWE